MRSSGLGALLLWLCVADLSGAEAMSSATVVSAPAALGSTKDGTPAYVYTLKSEVSPGDKDHAPARPPAPAPAPAPAPVARRV